MVQKLYDKKRNYNMKQIKSPLKVRQVGKDLEFNQIIYYFVRGNVGKKDVIEYATKIFEMVLL